MKTFEVKVIGWVTVPAETADKAQEKFDAMMRDGLLVSDLRWKETTAEENKDE